MKSIGVSLLIAAVFSFSAEAQSLKILCENSPPAQFMGTGGEITGFTVELVREIQKRVGSADEIKMVPWARGYDLIQKRADVVLFSMARTKDREALFNWVGPIQEASNGFFAKADAAIGVGSLGDAKKARLIGVVTNDVRDLFLTGEGFTNLARGSDNAVNIRNLMLGRIDLYADATNAYAANAAASGYAKSDLKLVYVFQKITTYIAMSKDMPPSVVNAWTAALEDMKKDGSFRIILKKYYPEDEPAEAQR